MNSINQRKIRASAVLFILAPIIFLLFEAIVASAWTSPVYSYIYNYVSDLGIPLVTQFQGRMVNSPISAVMNFGFIAYADLFVLAYCLIIHMLPAKRKGIAVALTVLYGVGFILVAIFPGYDWWGVSMHALGAAFVILGGNISMMFNGSLIQKATQRKGFATISIILGIIGILGLVLVSLFATNNIPYQGLVERISLYPMLAWELMTGISLMRSLQENHEKQVIISK